MNNVNNIDIDIEEQINTLNILVKTGKLTDDLLDIEKIFNYFLQSCRQLTNFAKYEDLLKYIKDADVTYKNIYHPNLLVFILHCKNTSPLVIKHLIDIGYDVTKKDSYGNGILSLYINFNGNIDTDTIKLIINSICNINISNANVLIRYMIYNKDINIDIIKLLINNDIDINYITDDKHNILHTACRYNRSLKIIKYLVKNGCDVNLRSNEGMTPLDRLLYYSITENRKDVDIKYRNYKPMNKTVKYLLSVMDNNLINANIYKDYLLNKINKKCLDLIKEMKKNPINKYYNDKKNIDGFNLLFDKFDTINKYIESETGLKDFLDQYIEDIEDNSECINILDIMEICFNIKQHYQKIDKLREELKEYNQSYINCLINIELN